MQLENYKRIPSTCVLPRGPQTFCCVIIPKRTPFKNLPNVKKDKVVPVHTKKAYGGAEVQLYSFLTSLPHGREWSTSRPGRFTSKEHRCPLNRRLSGPHSRSGNLHRRKKNCSGGRYSIPGPSTPTTRILIDKKQEVNSTAFCRPRQKKISPPPPFPPFFTRFLITLLYTLHTFFGHLK